MAIEELNQQKANAAQPQEHVSGRPPKQSNGDEAGQAQSEADNNAEGIRLQGGRQLQRRGNHQSCHYGSHTAQRAGNLRMSGKPRVDQSQQQGQDGRQRQQAAQRGYGAGPSEAAGADHQRQVPDIRTRQDLRHRPLFDELLAGEPVLAVHQLALCDRHDAAEAL